MSHHRILEQLVALKKNKQKALAVLIDPDKVNDGGLETIIAHSLKAKVDFFFVGGSLVVGNCVDNCIKLLKKQAAIPVVLFPGAPTQVSPFADAILFLSLISGRNPELLIGQHVLSAPMIKSAQLEVLPTGYLVIDGGKPTAVSYISNAQPIPADKNDIAMCTAMAGEMLGLRVMYMDAGSGALNAISPAMITKVSKAIDAPLIVGGGIRTVEAAKAACAAGADTIVVGNAFEEEASLIFALAEAVHNFEK